MHRMLGLYWIRKNASYAMFHIQYAQKRQLLSKKISLLIINGVFGILGWTIVNGDKLLCIDNKQASDLIEGKIYTFNKYPYHFNKNLRDLKEFIEIYNNQGVFMVQRFIITKKNL